MRIIIGTALFLLILSGASYSKEVIQVDNQFIQEYKGHCGLWATVESSAKLNYYLNKFFIKLKDVQEINGTITYGDGKYVFVPYSEKYLAELEAQGIKRETVANEKNDFIWPLIHVDNISSLFGQRGSRFHTGTDMPATQGTPIIAVMDGRVVTASYDAGFGKTICIEHRDGFMTRYAHCYSLLVKAGDIVKKGQMIGLVGSTGTSTGNHLHFEIRYNDIPLNPLDFLPIKENLVQLHMLRNWN